MTTYVITLINGWTVLASSGSFLRALYRGDPIVEVPTPKKVYHLPAGSIVCVQEEDRCPSSNAPAPPWSRGGSRHG